MMYFWTLAPLAFLAVTSLHAADERQLALSLAAQADFNRVELAAVPQLRDTASCVQTQAALLPVASREELPLVHYRKGYCSLGGAVITRNPADFSAAAAELDRAVETWPDRVNATAKNKAPEPVSSGLRVLAVVARLQAGAGNAGLEAAQNDLALAVEAHACPASVMSAAFCEEVLQTGRDWLGWIALQHDDLYAAAKNLSGAKTSGWSYWTAGKQAFRDRNYPEAAAQYRRAVETWERSRREAAPALIERLKPQPEMAQALVELGGAQILARDYSGAVATLNAAAKSDPGYARTLYLRARAKDLAGDSAGAMADYNLAARTAFAAAKDLASGEAHLYRGVMLYRRKDFAHAEDEFASALNFDISASMRADAEGWRHLAAVSGGSCAESRERLERALESASPFFPREEAREASWACLVRSTSAAEIVGQAVPPARALSAPNSPSERKTQ
jgi:Tfp pilus assembly protein PilF